MLGFPPDDLIDQVIRRSEQLGERKAGAPDLLLPLGIDQQKGIAQDRHGEGNLVVMEQRFHAGSPAGQKDH